MAGKDKGKMLAVEDNAGNTASHIAAKRGNGAHVHQHKHQLKHKHQYTHASRSICGNAFQVDAVCVDR